MKNTLFIGITLLFSQIANAQSPGTTYFYQLCKRASASVDIIFAVHLIKQKLNFFSSHLEDCEDAENALIRKTELDFSNSELVVVAPLGGLTNLKKLNLSNNKIKNVSALGTLENLEYLDLRNNEVKIIRDFNTLTKLKALDLSYNDVLDVSPLKDLDSLTQLNLNNNPIETCPANGSSAKVSDYCHSWLIRNSGGLGL